MLIPRLVFAAILLPSLGAAQDSARAVAVSAAREPLPVRTFTLRRLDQSQAGRLVSPYIQTPNAGVFPGASSHEITVRAPQQMLRLVDSLLRAHDRPAATVSLRFQLYAAMDSGGDPLPQDIGPALRSAFRFSGYRLVSQGSISTSEDGNFSTTLGAAAMHGGAVYRVNGRVEAIAGTANASLPLTIRLSEAAPGGGPGPEVFSTGLTVPLGQTVVLGGILETEERNTTTKVPLLGDVPVLGRLFKTTRDVNNKDELLIFVTPKILHEGVNVY